MSFSYSRTVRLADTDAAGVVYFAQVLVFCHEAYEASLVRAKVSLQTLLSSSVALPIIYSSAHFFQPILWGETVEVEVFPLLVSDTEFAVDYNVMNTRASKSISAQATTRHVCIHSQSRTRRELPDILRQWISVA